MLQFPKKQNNLLYRDLNFEILNIFVELSNIPIKPNQLIQNSEQHCSSKQPGKSEMASLRQALKASAEEAAAELNEPTPTPTEPEPSPKRKKKQASKASKPKVKKKEQPVHPIPAPKSAFVIYAGATHVKAREAAGLKGMTEFICTRWSKLTKNQRNAFTKKEASDKKRFEKQQEKNLKLSFNQLIKTFLFPQGLEILEQEVEKTISTWNGGHNDSCEACGLGGDILLCEACNLTYHPKCLNILNVAQEGWLCPECCEELYRKVEKNVRRDEKLKLEAELEALDEEEGEKDFVADEEENHHESDETDEQLAKMEEAKKRAKKEAKRLRKLDRQEKKREKRKRRSQERSQERGKSRDTSLSESEYVPSSVVEPAEKKLKKQTTGSGGDISYSAIAAAAMSSSLSKAPSKSSRSSRSSSASRSSSSSRSSHSSSHSSSSTSSGSLARPVKMVGRWLCGSCNFKNNECNTVCGGVGTSHGCNAPRTAESAPLPDKKKKTSSYSSYSQPPQYQQPTAHYPYTSGSTSQYAPPAYQQTSAYPAPPAQGYGAPAAPAPWMGGGGTQPYHAPPPQHQVHYQPQPTTHYVAPSVPQSSYIPPQPSTHIPQAPAQPQWGLGASGQQTGVAQQQPQQQYRIPYAAPAAPAAPATTPAAPSATPGVSTGFLSFLSSVK